MALDMALERAEVELFNAVSTNAFRHYQVLPGNVAFRYYLIRGHSVGKLSGASTSVVNESDLFNAVSTSAWEPDSGEWFALNNELRVWRT